MPIYLNELDVNSEVAGLSSVLIVPCNMCPAVTMAVKAEKPFIQFFRKFLKSAPFERYIRKLQDQLKEKGVNTKVFKNKYPHQYFLCMWTSGRCKKLQKYAKRYEAIIVLGCTSATETVRESVRTADCKVIQGMEFGGFMNAKLRFHLPCNVSFEDCKIIPLPQLTKEKDMLD